MRPPVACAFPEEGAAPAPSEEHDLPFGVSILLRPETGLASATIEAQVSRDLWSFHQGHDVLARYGFAPEEAGLLADVNIASGFGIMLHACVRAAALIEDWNLVDPAGEPIPVSLETVRALFHHGVGPGTGGMLMAAFQRVCDAPRHARAAEGNGSAPSPNGATAAERPTAQAAAPKASPAPSEGEAMAHSAPRSSTGRKRSKD